MSIILASLESQSPYFSAIAATKGGYAPRYNVMVDEAANKAVYEVALPGHSKDDVEVRYSDGRLTVSSLKTEADSSGYVVQTFGKTPFMLSWAVSDSEVESASMSDGVLRVTMTGKTPSRSDLIPIT